MARKKNVNSYLTALAAVILVIAVCIAAYLIAGKEPVRPDEYPFHVSFIDVGQGDCELIRCEGATVLIDGGEAECGDAVVRYLKSCAVENIDCYILTHPHTDHIGAAAYIMENFPVSDVIMTTFSEFNVPTTMAYENMLDAVASFGINVNTVTAGKKFECGALTLEILSPAEETDDYNDMSVVVKAKYKNNSVLFMGDASSAIEEKLLNGKTDLSADIIKIGHHGSGNSSSDGFIRAVSPEYAVISCGEKNQFGHPADETLNVLVKNGAEIYRTDVNGTVVFYGDGRNLIAGAAG